MPPLDLDGLDGLFSSDLPEHVPAAPAAPSAPLSEAQPVERRRRSFTGLWIAVGAGLGVVVLAGLALGFVAVGWAIRAPSAPPPQEPVATSRPVEAPAVAPPPPAPPPSAPTPPAPTRPAPTPPEASAPAAPAEWVVHFAHDSVEPLDPEVPEWVRRCPAVEVVGYTDATGADDVNDVIGRGRAEAVRRVLSVAGVPRVTTASAGEGEADPQAPPLRRDQDRRAVARCAP